MRADRDEQRRAVRQRLPLLALATVTLAAALTAQFAPATAAWLASPRPTLYLLLSTALGIALYALRRAYTAPRWSSIDSIAWVAVLSAAAVLAGSATAPVPFGALLYCTGLLMLGVRDPSDALVLSACITAALAPVTRVLMHEGVAAPSVALVSGLGMMAFTAVTAQTRLLLRAVAERDAALTRGSMLTRRAPAARESSSASESAEDRFAALRGPAAAIAELVSRSSHSEADHSWDALVERLRTSVTGMAESAGVSASVSAEVKGLAPPPARIRTHLVKIAQEATTQTLRTTDARSIDLSLSRGDGGVVLELRDDGPASDGTRPKRTLAALRTRVAAAGGTAEVRRGDAGWVTRVKLPCEQLN